MAGGNDPLVPEIFGQTDPVPSRVPTGQGKLEKVREF